MAARKGARKHSHKARHYKDDLKGVTQGGSTAREVLEWSSGCQALPARVKLTHQIPSRCHPPAVAHQLVVGFGKGGVADSWRAKVVHADARL